MKRIFTFGCLICLFCLMFCFGAETQIETTSQNNFVNSKIVDSDFPNIFKPFGDLFKKVSGKRKEFTCSLPPSVTALDLDKSEITGNCLTSANYCSNDSQIIKVKTVALDDNEHPLKYFYTVSVGKIVGVGSEVIWDLSGVKSGNYTITAAVDDGCGFCGSPMTKTVIVK